MGRAHAVFSFSSRSYHPVLFQWSWPELWTLSSSRKSVSEVREGPWAGTRACALQLSGLGSEGGVRRICILQGWLSIALEHWPPGGAFGVCEPLSPGHLAYLKAIACPSYFLFCPSLITEQPRLAQTTPFSCLSPLSGGAQMFRLGLPGQYLGEGGSGQALWWPVEYPVLT